jgi:Arc/MetJ-type ribon-helix-helix transcriptional regulator
MRRALESASREQVLERVLAALPDEGDDAETGYRDKVQKVSVSMPADLTEAVRRRTGTGGFSRYVSDAVQQRIRRDLMTEFLDEMDAKYGPIPPEFEEEARLLWPDESP